MFGWPIVALALFTVLSPRRAVCTGVTIGWLFLPMASYHFSGLPDLTKAAVVSGSLVAGAAAFDSARFATLRFCVTDMAALVWLSVPLASAAANGMGLQAGLSGAANQSITWGLPYLLGRLYFTDADGLRDLALCFVVGGVVYAPLVLLEARLSPQLHGWVYGYHQHVFAQTRRGDGFRPTVFMQHGLAVAMYMGTAAVCSIWLSYVRAVRFFWVIPAWFVAVSLFAIAASCRSTYALILMVVGTMTLAASRILSTKLILMALITIAPIYMVARVSGSWNGEELMDAAALMDEGRESSLAVRLASEQTLLNWTRGSVVLGHGLLGDLFATDPTERGVFLADSLWIITLGKHGIVGIASLFAILLFPPLRLLCLQSSRTLFSKSLAGAFVLSLSLVLFALDALMNAMFNPMILAAAGGLAAFRIVPDPAHVSHAALADRDALLTSSAYRH
jgi:hypothetical protein